jgi:hypothetical protein
MDHGGIPRSCRLLRESRCSSDVCHQRGTGCDPRRVRAARRATAVVELRRLFPGVTDNRQARECVRMIAGWKPRELQRNITGTEP